jgi:selenocysteine lyase/cysteine desulfurase
VALGTIDWTDGTPFALNEIGVRARAVGAAYILDGIQSIGALPFDVGVVRPDLMVASAYKWLGGPTGIGAAFIGERFAAADPLEETWLGRAGSDDFSHLTDYDVGYRSTAERFDQGGRAQHVLLPMLNAALEQLLTRDPARIQAYCRGLVLTLSNALVSLGFDIDAEGDRCNHLFAVRLPHALSALAAQRWLKAQCRVHVAVRESSLRVSPNVYNDENDMEALANGLAEIRHRSTPTMLHAFRTPAPAWRSHAQ